MRVALDIVQYEDAAVAIRECGNGARQIEAIGNCDERCVIGCRDVIVSQSFEHPITMTPPLATMADQDRREPRSECGLPAKCVDPRECATPDFLNGIFRVPRLSQETHGKPHEPRRMATIDCAKRLLVTAAQERSDQQSVCDDPGRIAV